MKSPWWKNCVISHSFLVGVLHAEWLVLVPVSVYNLIRNFFVSVESYKHWTACLWLGIVMCVV